MRVNYILPILMLFQIGSLIKTVNLQNKKLITISPGGFKGFYMLGVCSFIKENYPLEQYYFSGASAGAWNALFMTYKGEPDKFVRSILDKSVQELSSAVEIKTKIKEKILTSYNETDFHLDRLLISVSSFEKYKMKPVIYSDFDNLEDAINCCIASSHIPFVTGGITNKYHNTYSFDGGFSKYPFSSIQNIKPVLHITPDIWKKQQEKTLFQKMTKFCQIREYTTLLSRDKYDFEELYEQGYSDSEKNKFILDFFLSS
jgi:hypothetical protein